MSDKIKGVKIRYENNQLSNEIPIGALSQNVDYNDENVKTVLDKLDFIDRIQTGAGEKSLILGNGSLANGDYSLAIGNNTQALTIGSYAEGYATKSNGRYSHAEGHSTSASGQDGHAEGRSTQATGAHAHAEGYWTSANGQGSHAEGNQTQATGQFSHAEGYYTIASGKYSHAGGNGTQARGQADTALGVHTIANGAIDNPQFVFGAYNVPSSELRPDNNLVNAYLEIVGSGSDKNNRKNARTLDKQGNEWIAGTLKVGGHDYDDDQAVAVATGAVYKGDRTDSVVLNNKINVASGKNSTATGSSFVSGISIRLTGEANAVEFSYAGSSLLNEYYLALIECGAGRIFETFDDIDFFPQLGKKIINIDTENQIITLDTSLSSQNITNKKYYLCIANTAKGESSFVNGSENASYGKNSHAEGVRSCAIGEFSHAEGKETRAIGESSHAQGIGTIANHRSQKVSGEYNIPDGNFTRVYEKGDYVEIIGNGTSNERSNARTLDWDGNEWLAGTLKIGGSDYNDSNAQQVATKQYVTEKIENAVINQSEIALDSTLTKENQAAQAKAVGTKFNEITNRLNGIPTNLSTTLNNYIQKPGTNGNNGDILQNNSNGTTSWVKPLKVGTTTGSAADGKLVNDFINNINNNYSTTSVLDGRYIQKPNSNVQSGLVLMSNGPNSIKWQSMSLPNVTINSQTMTAQEAIQELSENQNSYIKKPITNSNGENGQILSTNGDGTTSWIDKSFVNKPNNNGISGQVLKTNGDGTTTWVNFIGNTAGTAVDAAKFNTLNTKVDTFFANNEKFDPDLSKNFYGKKILFIGDSYCQGYATDTSARNYGWAKYCGDFLNITRTSSNLTAPLNMDDVGPTIVQNTTYDDRDDKTSNDKYEIICNGGARFAGGNTTGTNFKQLLTDAHDNKFVTRDANNNKIPYKFTDIIVCGGYNDRNSSKEVIEQGIKDFCAQAQIYYGENINIYIGQIAKSTDETEQSKIDTKVTPAYKNCNKYGAFYLYNVQDILVNSEISNDGYHPNESGNQTIGKAVALALLTKRNYLFISDARYARQEWGWIRYCIDYMGLTHTFYNESSFAPDNASSSRVDKSLFNNCEIIYDDTIAGVARFSETTSYITNTTFPTYEALLQKAHDYKFRGYYFTDIVVCGGLSEQTSRNENDPNKTTSAIIGKIQTGIQNFMQYKEKYYPYANVYIGHIGYSTNTNTNNFMKEVSIPAYQSCGNYGATYLSNVQYWPTKSGIFEVEFVNGSDKIGTAYANKKGLQSIGRAVASALLTGSAPLPNPTIKTFDETLKNV